MIRRMGIPARKAALKLMEVLVLSMFVSGVIFWCTGGGDYVVKRINGTEVSIEGDPEGIPDGADAGTGIEDSDAYHLENGFRNGQ